MDKSSFSLTNFKCIMSTKSKFREITGQICPEHVPRDGVLNRGEISPMGEILGIQGGNESV